jgi:acetyltransferase
MWILTAPVVDAYPVLNVHPGDLTVRADGQRKYVGADPVYDAVAAGDDATRSTVHFVTTEVDEGPILARSRPLQVHRDLVTCLDGRGANDELRDYVDAHQEWMKWEADGPAIATALSLVAAGRVDREGGTVRIDGKRGFYDLGSESVEVA